MVSENCSEAKSEENYALPEDFPNPLDSDQRMALATLFSIAAAGCIIGNLWTLITLHKKIYQTLYKFCLASLSVSDLILGVVVGTDNIMRLITPNIGWVLGDGMCQAIPLLTTSCMLASSFTLTCIAADRYHGIAWLHDRVKPSLFNSISAIVVIWAISFGASVHMYFLYTPKEFCIINIETVVCEDCATLCLSTTQNYPTYFTCLYAGIFVPLLLIFLLSYIMIAWRVWGRRWQVGRSGDTPSTTSTTEIGSSTTSIISKPPATAHTKKKLRTFRVVLIIMATFVVCRIPSWTFNLVTLQTFTPGVDAYSIRFWLSILTVFNTAINPLLYSFLDSMIDFKGKFYSVCRGCRK